MWPSPIIGNVVQALQEYEMSLQLTETRGTGTSMSPVDQGDVVAQAEAGAEDMQSSIPEEAHVWKLRAQYEEAGW